MPIKNLTQLSREISNLESKKLRQIAMNIDKIPFEFSYDGRSVNMVKVQKFLRNYH